MRVAVLCGGRSSEREVSLRSGQAVARGLAEAGHEATLVTIDAVGVWRQGDRPVELVPGDGLLGSDVAFPVLHGPFVGSDVLSSAICMDKLTLKRLYAQAGLPQVEFVSAAEPDWRERCERIGAPLWVKPSRLGSSVGINRVDDLGDLDGAIELARRHDPRVIVEASAKGREVECSLLGDERVETSLPGEVVAHGEWYDYETKYRDGGMELVVPAPISDEQAERLQRLAVEAFELGGCSGLARCDFFVEPGGEVLVNEVNTMPGFTETSVYAKLWEASGISYPDLCDRLVKLAIERHERARSYEF